MIHTDAAVEAETVNILLVDDRPENLVAVRAALNLPGYNVVTAQSGAEALRALLRDEFALILLDVLMPEMDGFELAALIKAREPTRAVPIIFLTAVGGDLSFIYRGYSAGAVDYLVKPVDSDVVRAKVAVFVDLHRKTLQIRRQADLLRDAERRERAAQLREMARANEERYRNLADAIPQIVWTARADGTPDHFNQRWHSFTGLAPERSMKGGWLALVHPEDRARCDLAWRGALQTGNPLHIECRLRHADGSYPWHLGRALPERNADQQIVAWLGTFTDIDERKRTEAALDQFKITLDSVHDAVWMFDVSTLCFTYANETATARLGIEAADVERTGPLEFLPLLDRTRFDEILAPLRAGTTDVVKLESFERGRGNSERAIEMAIQKVASRVDKPRFVAIVRDVTDRQRAEAERARLLADSQAAVRSRDQFLSVASHELKTPVTALQLHIDHLVRSAREHRAVPQERLQHSLTAVDRQVQRLTRLIDNLLDVSRVTETRLDLVVEDVDLRQIVEAAVERFLPEARRAACSIEVTSDEAVRGVWDGGRLDQLVMQLLGNAVKYGAGKPVEINVRNTGDRVRLSVRDRGIGISSDDHQRIFQRFERASSERQYGGLGLGLWIVQQIVTAHGGEIRVQSTMGEGATFEVDLPTRATIPDAGARSSETRLESGSRTQAAE